IDEEAPYTFTASGSDDDLPAQTLTFSLSGAPAGAAIGAGDGIFTWTPSEAQGGSSYTFDVVLSDGVTSVSQSITINVDKVNVAPVLTTVPSSVTIDEETHYTFTASGSDTDLPAQTLTFSLSGAPAGAAIGANDGVFTWTPSEADGPGVYTFDVVLSDGM